MAETTHFQLHDNSLVSDKHNRQPAESSKVQSNSICLGVLELPTQT